MMLALSNLATVALFAVVGWLSGRFIKTASRRTVVLLVVAAVVGAWTGVNTQLLSIFGFVIRPNWAIPAFCAGMLVRVLVRGRLRASAA